MNLPSNGARIGAATLKATKQAKIVMIGIVKCIVGGCFFFLVANKMCCSMFNGKRR